MNDAIVGTAVQIESQWKPYPTYKDSGIEWLGEIPAHWDMKRLKFLFNFLDSRRIPLSGEVRATMAKEYPYYGASGIIDYVADYIFDEPLILVSEDGANLFSRSSPLAFTATGKYWVNNHAHILKPRDGLVDYWSRVLASVVYDPWITGSAQPKLNSENLGTIELPTPSLEDRHAIAAFLDHETAQIDTLIAKKERLIELLTEKRIALISHAVTKGLDPTVQMKDSGVEWLGEIPAHWEIKRLRFIAEVRSGVTKGRNLGERDTAELPYLRVANVQDGYLDLSDLSMITVGTDEVERYDLQVGDVLMNEGGDFDKLGRGAVWEGEITPCLHQNHVFAVRPLKKSQGTSSRNALARRT